jgi:hypothetical protein
MIFDLRIALKIAGLAVAAFVLTGPLYRQQWDVVFIQVLVLGAAWIQTRRINRFAKEVCDRLDGISASLDRMNDTLDSERRQLSGSD